VRFVDLCHPVSFWFFGGSNLSEESVLDAFVDLVYVTESINSALQTHLPLICRILMILLYPTKQEEKCHKALGCSPVSACILIY